MAYESQERWQKKVGLISKSYKLNKTIVDEFKEACDRAGVTQKQQLERMMKYFCEDHPKENGK